MCNNFTYVYVQLHRWLKALLMIHVRLSVITPKSRYRQFADRCGLNLNQVSINTGEVGCVVIILKSDDAIQTSLPVGSSSRRGPDVGARRVDSAISSGS